MRFDIQRCPPATVVFRPEKPQPKDGTMDRLVRNLGGKVGRPLRSRFEDGRRVLRETNRYGPEMENMPDIGLREAAKNLGNEMSRRGFRRDLVARSFALIREAAGRALGMRHFDCQILGGWVLLRGMIAEMETGEGKTLTATLAAGTAALAGIPVHVITVNDYLASRDAEWMAPVYRLLNLPVGCITHGMNGEERRSAYRCAVTYVTNKEIVFDYLRDKLILGDRSDPLHFQAKSLAGGETLTRRLVLRGLVYAIVDEADSVLIDEARTPLVISAGARGEDGLFMREGLEIARSLIESEDYRIKRNIREVDLTDRGKDRIEALSAGYRPLWKQVRRREEIVTQALTALHLFRRDDQYLVRDGKVVIVDEFTGRVMPDRSWERGLHQLIELKEGCDVTHSHDTLARISYQRFFRRYLHLAGMTGTAREAAGELGEVYDLPVVRIATNRPMRRIRLPDRVYPTPEAKWQAVVFRIRQLHAEGRPVLVGTRSVAASEHISLLLTEAGLEHQVLNAKFDREEAEIIARAGEFRRITIATNMAGRGTDIKLDPGISELGGLHVILTERHEAGRIDRQLAGRCGRQGDPGSYEVFLSMRDFLLESRKPGPGSRIMMKLLPEGSYLWSRIANRVVLRAQKKLERVHARIRQDLLREDERRGKLLSFSAWSE